MREEALTSGGIGRVESGGQAGGGGGGAYVPVLTSIDGLDALPAWQRQAVLFAGVRL